MAYANSKLKMFVNNPELWGSFTEEVNLYISFCHKQMEQTRDTSDLFRLQGEIRALRKMLSLRDKVNG